MSVVFSMYDAPVSINVPDDKAKAVIDAMEREMMGKLATKADLEGLRLATRADFAAVRGEMGSEFKLVRQEMAAMRDSLSKDIQNLPNAMTIKFGTMMVGAVVVTCTVLGTLQILF